MAAAGEVGLGHLARSTALAQALAIRDVDVTAVASGAGSPIDIDGLLWEPDAEPPPSPDLAVYDGYDLPAAAVEAHSGQRTFWMHPPPAGVAAGLHLDLSGSDETSLTGLGFACLRRDYWGGSGARETRADAPRVLVTVGGSDAGGPVGEIAARVLAAAPGAQVTMVRGPQSSSDAPPGVDVADAPGSLRPLLETADLVVSAAGQTMLESMSAGAPTIGLVRAENQRRQAGLAAGSGGVLLLGHDELESGVESLLADDERRAALAAAATTVVDGLGAHRAADEILERLLGREAFDAGGIRLRDAGIADAEFLLELRNDPSAYPLYRVPRPVEEDEHADWLKGVLDSGSATLLVVEESGERVGQARIDPVEADPEAHELSISLLASARGRGIGRRTIAAACIHTWVRANAGRIVASVHPDNEASMSAFGAVGFHRDGEDAAGFPRLVLERHRFDWPSGGARR